MQTYLHVTISHHKKVIKVFFIQTSLWCFKFLIMTQAPWHLLEVRS